MGALRDSENALIRFRGRPDDNVSGMTFPRELTRWLRACGCYADVRDETTLSCRRAWRGRWRCGRTPGRTSSCC
ncbi:MAG: hypothetical protein U0470_13310 [Anaerolineae bacterium]